MLSLAAGDLIRWKNPLLTVNEGRVLRANEAWYHALVVEIKEARIITTPSAETWSVRLLLLGRKHHRREVYMTVDALGGLAPVERIVDCVWVELDR